MELRQHYKHISVIILKLIDTYLLRETNASKDGGRILRRIIVNGGEIFLRIWSLKTLWTQLAN